MQPKQTRAQKAQAQFAAGKALVWEHPLFDSLYAQAKVRDDERGIWQRLQDGVPPHLPHVGIGAPGKPDLLRTNQPKRSVGQKQWGDLFAQALQDAVRTAVDLAGSVDEKQRPPETVADRARLWFINHYPLLGALATG